MKTLLATCVAAALLLEVAAVPAAEDKGAPTKGGEAGALEKKLLGTWRGPACGGDYTFSADGTYVCKNFSPGNYTLTGTWSVRWDALPPTLILTSKTSDFTTKGRGGGEEWVNFGKALEMKLVELRDDALVFQPAARDEKWVWRGTRPAGKGGEAPEE